MDTEKTDNTYTVMSFNVSRLMFAVEKLNKRAKRLGVALLVVTVLGRRTIKRWSDRDQKRVEVSVTDVKVEGEEVKLDGWKLAGVIEHAAGGCIVRSAIDGFDLSEYRDADPLECDHCHTRRRRNDTFVLLHDDGRKVRVGRTCLKDYLGHGSVASLVWRADVMLALREVEESSEYMGGGGNDNTPLGEYLGYVAMSIRENGWIARSSIRSERESATADDAMHCLYGQFQVPKDERREPTAEDFARGEEALAWVTADLEREKAERGHNDYQHNLLVIIKGGFTTGRQAGYAASIVSYYDRAMGRLAIRKAQAKATANSEHVGKVGERMKFPGASVTRVNTFDGYYGLTWIYTLLHEGNVLTWFASRGQEVNAGDTVNLVGTVKKHDDYKGTAQTVLTRCKLTAVEG